MTNVGECAVLRQELAVYVLGAIEPAGRALVDGHLRSCPRCREELAGLAGLPALLRKVPIVQAVAVCGEGAGPGEMAAAPAGELLGALLARAARVRRLRRWRLAVAAAVLAAATAAGWGLQARQAQPPPPAGSGWALTAAGFNPATRAGMTVRYAARAWGTLVEVHVNGIPAGATCQFWVTSSSGGEIPAGGWAIPAGQRQAWYPASVPVQVSALRGFAVTSAGKTLVTAHPPGAAAAGTRGLTVNPPRGYRQ